MNQPKEGKYILLKEYLLVLFIVGDYESIVPLIPENTFYLNASTRFPDLFRDLQAETIIRIQTIYSDIQNIANKNESHILRRTFYQLLAENNNRKTTPNFGIGFGMYFQKAFYIGEVSDYANSHHLWVFPLLNWDVWYNNFVSQVILGFGASKTNSITINGDIFDGKFSGENIQFLACIGYEAYSTRSFSIIPNVGFEYHESKVFTEIAKKNNYLKSFMKESSVRTCSAGFMIDYKITRPQMQNGKYFSIRFKYDFCVPAFKDKSIGGSLHQFTLGLVFTPDIKKIDFFN